MPSCFSFCHIIPRKKILCRSALRTKEIIEEEVLLYTGRLLNDGFRNGCVPKSHYSVLLPDCFPSNAVWVHILKGQDRRTVSIYRALTFAWKRKIESFIKKIIDWWFCLFTYSIYSLIFGGANSLFLIATQLSRRIHLAIHLSQFATHLIHLATFLINLATYLSVSHTVKRVDEVVPHRHLVTQDQTTQVSNKFFHIHVKLIVCKCRTSSTEQESVKSSMRGGGREPTTYRTSISHCTTAPRFQLLSGDEKKVIESMSSSLSLSNFFDSENIGWRSSLSLSNFDTENIG